MEKKSCMFTCLHLTVSPVVAAFLEHLWVGHKCSWSDPVLFQMGLFYYAAKAFDALEKLDPDSNYWEGKRGACVGVFQLILANKESKYVSLFPLGLHFIMTHLSVCCWFSCKIICCRNTCKTSLNLNSERSNSFVCLSGWEIWIKKCRIWCFLYTGFMSHILFMF